MPADAEDRPDVVLAEETVRGAGGHRMVSLAAREADIIGLLPSMLPSGQFADDAELSVEAFTRKVDSVRAQAGDRFAQIEFNILIQTLTVTDDPSAELERLRGEIGPLADPWFASPMVYVGSVDEIADKLRQVRTRVGASYFVVFEPAMEGFPRCGACPVSAPSSQKRPFLRRQHAHWLR